MSDRLTRTQDHGLRIERVIQWLADHLDETLDLQRLSELACMSPFHFHRTYHALHGETVNETVRRLRLHRAAVELITGELLVQEIARRAGYSSHEAFTRAFKAAYGVPPAVYRASIVPDPRASATKDIAMRANYQVTIRHTRPITLAALPHRGDYMQMPQTFERLAATALRMNLLGPETRSFGIYYDDPSAVTLDALRADACISAPDVWTPSDPLERREIPGGRYAVVVHVGPYAELERAYQWLYGAWLVDSGEEPADFPCVEAYLNDWRTVPVTDLRTEILLPLR